MKVSIYARVSTDKQTDINQVIILKEWAASKGWELVEIFEETGSAFQHADQKKLREAIEAGRVGKFQSILIYDMSRLTREGPRANLNWLEKCSAAGLQVMSYRESWVQDITNPALREAVVGLFAYVNKQESEDKSERTKAGMERARQQGKHIGRPRKKVLENS